MIAVDHLVDTRLDPTPAPPAKPAQEERRESFSSSPGVPIVPLVSPRLQRISLIVVAGIAFLAAAWIVSSLWAGLLLGVITAFSIEPWNRYLLRRWPRRRSLAAATSVTVVGLLCAGVITGLTMIITHELFDAIHGIRELAAGAVLSPSARRSLAAIGVTPAMLSAQLTHVADRSTEIVSGLASAALGSMFSLLGGVLLAFVTAYYTLRDQHPIERWVQRLLPLNPWTTHELVEDFRKVGRGTLVGSVLAGLTQGVLAAVGFAIGGVPRALLLGVLIAVASFIPVFGTLLVWLPVCIWLLAAGHPVAAIFEIAWSVLVTTTLVDYVIRPVLMGRGSRSHPFLFLIGVIGGAATLGGVGVIAGPIVMAFFSSVLRIYRRDIVETAGSVAEQGAKSPRSSSIEG